MMNVNYISNRDKIIERLDKFARKGLRQFALDLREIDVELFEDLVKALAKAEKDSN